MLGFRCNQTTACARSVVRLRLQCFILIEQREITRSTASFLFCWRAVWRLSNASNSKFGDKKFLTSHSRRLCLIPSSLVCASTDKYIHIPNACTFRSLQFRHSVSPVWLTTRAQNDVTQRGNCDMPKWSTIRYYVQLQWSFAVRKRSNEWWWRGTMCASCWCNTRKVEIRFFLRFIPRWISINHVKEKFSLSPRKAIRKIRKLIFVVGVLKWRFWRMELICQ